VIPNWKEQEWDPLHPENYAGIFHFRFWLFGEWMDVVVDDRLPTINGELIYCHSKVRNEFWSALLEKAYAKLSECYESLDGGNTADAVVDFTGAVTESINLKKGKYKQDIPAQIRLYEDLLSVFEGGGIISCSIKASRDDFETRLPSGLVRGHAYSVTAVRKARIGHGQPPFQRPEKVFLIRMRNPWGRTEWKGPWSDGSQEWQSVSSVERNAMGITVENDGEFWMAIDDWFVHFTDVDVCRLMNTSFLSLSKTWHEAVHFGSWTQHTNPLYNRCGGYSSILQNPQFVFDVTKAEDEVLISLQQRDRKIHARAGQGKNLTIGFAVFKVEINRTYRMHALITQPNVAISTFINARSVFMRKSLPRGRYIVIPSTHMPRDLGEFMLRVYTDTDSACRELTEDKPRVRCWTACLGYPRIVTHIYVHGAEGLQKQHPSGGVDPYVIIYCERSSVQSEVQKDTLEPLFDTRAIFYRKNPRKPIIIQVWDSNTVQDQFLGQVVLSASLKDSSEPQSLQLHKRGHEMAEEMPGTISLRVVTSSQLTAL
ncbi:hypothetical protein MATL_G00166820, partial [Megalops atlanticus]